MRRRELMLVLGGAMTAARPLRAQQKAMPVIGFLSSVSPGPSAPNVAAFRQGLSQTGYVEGQNLAIEYRWAELKYDRLPALAADLVARKVDVIATNGDPHTALAAKDATSTVPIVFSAISDPVSFGLVASLARPGGNLTGVSPMNTELMPKRFELLSELVPQAGVMTFLVNPNNSAVDRRIQDVQEAARAKGVQLAVLKASTESEIDAALASLAQQKAGALVVDPDPFFVSRREQIVALAGRHAIPAIYAWREATAEGGLISYGASTPSVYYQGGILTFGLGRVSDAEVSEAVHLAAHAIEIGKDDPDALWMGAHALSFFSRSHRTAARAVDRALTLNPSSAHAWMTSGRVSNRSMMTAARRQRIRYWRRSSFSTGFRGAPRVLACVASQSARSSCYAMRHASAAGTATETRP